MVVFLLPDSINSIDQNTFLQRPYAASEPEVQYRAWVTFPASPQTVLRAYLITCHTISGKLNDKNSAWPDRSARDSFIFWSP